MEQIPGPRALPVIGNLLDVKNEEGFIKGMEILTDIYGPVCQVKIAGSKSILIASGELLRQFADESQWEKIPPPVFSGNDGPQGLFTANNDDPDWGQAHRILAPAFGPLAIGEMFLGMRDIAYQMILKWSRQDEDQEILLTDDATRLTLDTIALCTMDYRFNSFYSTNMHPFVDAMLGFLGLTQKLGQQTAVMRKFLGSSDEAKKKENQDFMGKIAQQIIDERRANPKAKKDMLHILLDGKDPKTGTVMRDELVIAEMITFLIAGHETTSGLISFAFMNLLHNPRTYLKAQEEIDNIIGARQVELADLTKLKYLPAILRETLRLTPTAPLITKNIAPHRKNEYVTICDGKYHIEPGTQIRLLLAKCMRDPSYFGEDAGSFVPERMLEDNPDYDKIKRAWKPFGNGVRSCIGQEFAWQETLLIMSLILQNFDMTFVDPGYKLKIKQTLTVKPDHLLVKIRPRKGLDAEKIERRLYNKGIQTTSEENGEVQNSTNASLKAGPVILFGSNSGTCQSLAQKLASNLAIKAGVSATVQDLDSAVDNISTRQPFIVITSSYEGQPPDNAARFVTWLEGTKSSLTDVPYSVFGCGHRAWRDTFQRIPTLVDRLMEQRGATRIVAMGSTDVSEGKVLDDFSRWSDQLLQSIVGQHGQGDESGAAEDFAVISTDTRAQHLSSGLMLGKVKEVRTLTQPGEPEKRHLEVELPEGMTYEVGDYLSVLPINPEDLVRRILNHWSLPRDAVIELKTSAFGSLPTDTPLGIHDLLRGFFELSQPVSKSNINNLKQYTTDADTLTALESLTNEQQFAKMITATHTSLFDLLAQYPKINLPFQIYLSNLLPLHIRQYSISSSPLANPQTCTLTYTVVHHSANKSSPTPSYAHEGVASTYLSTLQPGDTLQLTIKRTASAHLPCPFRLPTPQIQATTPLIMYCAGTGLAPFRGFIQQRALTVQSNPSIVLAPALLFIGCRSATADRIYADELAEWERLGVVSVRYAFSQDSRHELAKGCKHVGDRIRYDAKEVVGLWEKGARIYMCGSRKVQESVRDVAWEIFEEEAKERGMSVEEMEKERVALKAGFAVRAVNDVFD